jgi:hypothetical protein
MSRRKAMAARKPSGRTKVEPQLPPPAETKRLRDAAVAGMRGAEWGTELGRLYLADKISSLQYSAGRRWAATVEAYAEACQTPRQPGTATLDPEGGKAADPDTPAGRKTARRHARAIETFNGAHEALTFAGRLAASVTRAATESQSAPCGQMELAALRAGLQHLAAHWETQRNARRK